MHLSDFDYELPSDLIAQQPLADRSGSRLLRVDRKLRNICDGNFQDLPGILRSDDLLVVNNTRVFPARLLGQTDTGAQVEIFLIREVVAGRWEALAKPAKRLKNGKKLSFDGDLAATVFEQLGDGKIIVEFEDQKSFEMSIEKIGRTPLPPYIKRDKSGIDNDRERYQTLFARNRGAIAAPTAGLHFTREILEGLRARGVDICEITLHVGYGTFEPVRENDLSRHSVQAERYEIDSTAADALNKARAEGRRIVAIGTTSTRALEHAVNLHGKFVAESSSATLTITPGYKFKAVEVLLTNFHLPRSSLLILVSAFAGHELIMKAYRHAVRSQYRFYSYGDCMLIT
jgi:S-adenosylmethionine:tRNA ribosyltransferase-isomerase